MSNLELLPDYYTYLREKKAEGKKVIAFMAHDNIPEELIDAAGFIPLKMIFSGNDELMDSSHDYLPVSTCSFAQTCIGLFSQKPPPSNFGFLELIDYFIVSNHCVSDVCASEIITKYFAIPRLNFYISYTQNMNAIKYFKLELMDFKQQLEDIRGNKINDEEVYKSIIKFNDFKKKLYEIENFKINGKEKLSFFQKAMLYGPDIGPQLENFVQKYKNGGLKYTNNLKDLILTGCSIFIGDYLIDLIEDGGGDIVFFDSWVGNRYYSQIFEDDILESNIDPLDFLVHRYKKNITGDHSVPNFLENKIQYIKNKIQDYKQETGKDLAVLNHIIKFCDHISIFQSFLKQRLQEKGIQVLNLERDYSRANRGQLSTRIEAFLEMI